MKIYTNGLPGFFVHEKLLSEREKMMPSGKTVALRRVRPEGGITISAPSNTNSKENGNHCKPFHVE